MTTLSAFAQREQVVEDAMGAEPYFVPQMADLSAEQAALINLFEGQDIGNLHVYAGAGEDYYYQGTPVPAGFSNLFRGSLARRTFVAESQLEAVMSIRGGEQELYLVRSPDANWAYEISLFAWDNDKLQKQQLLASYTCKPNRCIQVDSWIQDVNGDTYLDVIQKRKVTRSNGREKTRYRLYLMDAQGNLQRSKNLEMVDFRDYRMEAVGIK